MCPTASGALLPGRLWIRYRAELILIVPLQAQDKLQLLTAIAPAEQARQATAALQHRVAHAAQQVSTHAAKTNALKMALDLVEDAEEKKHIKATLVAHLLASPVLTDLPVDMSGEEARVFSVSARNGGLDTTLRRPSRS